MSNKIKVLTNISASQNVIVSGSAIISGSKSLATTSSFNKAAIFTSSGGFYDMNSAIHGLDTAITTLKNNIKTAYDSIRAVITGTLDVNGNKKINLTTTIPSGNLYFSTASLTSIGASVLLDTDEQDIYKNDLISLQLFNSASYLWVEIDAPTAVNDEYRMILINHGSLPIGSSMGGSNNQNGGGGNNGGNGGSGGENLVIIFAPITTPTGSVNESVSGAHEGYYIYSDANGNVTITINDFSASTSDGGISFYAVSNNYTGSITYDDTTDVITSNDFETIITIAGDVNTTSYNAPQENTLEPVNYANPSGQEGYNIIMPNLTSSIINDGNNVTVTIPVGTGSAVYVDTYSNTVPTTYDFNWSGGVYNNSGSDVTIYVPTFNNGGYWVGSSTGYSDNIITGSVSGSLRGTQFVSTARIKPPTVAGKTLLNVIVTWYGPSDIAAHYVFDPNDVYSPHIGDPAPGWSVMAGSPIDRKYHWNQYGAWDQNNYVNPLQVTSWFISADARQSYSPNRNYAIEPLVASKGSGLQGIEPDGTYNAFSGGELIIVTLGTAFVSWEFIYG